MPMIGRQRTFLGLAARSFGVWFGGIWLLCGVPFLVVGVYVGVDTIRQQARFRTEAQVSEGMVLTKRITRSSKNKSTSYWVRYRFPGQDGAAVTSETEVSGALWDRLVEREPVRVTYLPDRPGSSRIEDQGPDWVLPAVFAGLGLVLVPVGGWIFVGGLRRIRLELRLAREGARTEATVTDLEPASVSVNGIAQWRIRYRYRDHRGRERVGESGPMAFEEAQQWKPGDTGEARFDPHAPGTSVWIGRP
jgi:hypothetical protein